MRNHLIISASALLSMILAVPSRAWGPMGHRAVASMAESRLDATAAAEVRRLLPANASLADVANCADAILYGPVRCVEGLDIPERKDTRLWHFVNIPITGVPGSLETYCPRPAGSDHGDCISDRLNQQIRILKDTRFSDDDRRLALVLVVHLLGDLYQPLHVADDDDLGGGKKKVEIDGHGTSLHSAWDSMVVSDFVAESSVRFKPGAEPRSSGWMFRESVEGSRYSRDVQYGSWSKAGWQRLDDGPEAIIERAVWDTHALARVVYMEYFRGGSVLDAAYQEKMRPLAEKQLYKAGEGLAYVLNFALGVQYHRDWVGKAMSNRSLLLSAEAHDPWSVAR